MGANFEIKISPLMQRMNKLVNKIFADDKFASMFYGELSTEKNGLFLYSNAGHNPPIFLRNDSNNVELLNTTGPVLGPTPHAKFSVDNINIHPGDTLFIYSDGVTDSADVNFNNYGEERLIKLLKKIKNKPAKEIARAGFFLDPRLVVLHLLKLPHQHDISV